MNAAGVGVKLNVFDPLAGTVTPIASVVVPDVLCLQPNIMTATVQLYVSNLFDSDYRSFVGVPNIGWVALLQLKYVFWPYRLSEERT